MQDFPDSKVESQLIERQDLRIAVRSRRTMTDRVARCACSELPKQNPVYVMIASGVSLRANLLAIF